MLTWDMLTRLTHSTCKSQGNVDRGTCWNMPHVIYGYGRNRKTKHKSPNHTVVAAKTGRWRKISSPQLAASSHTGVAKLAQKTCFVSYFTKRYMSISFLEQSSQWRKSQGPTYKPAMPKSHFNVCRFVLQYWSQPLRKGAWPTAHTPGSRQAKPGSSHQYQTR